MRYSIIIPYCHGTEESTVQRRELDSLLGRLDRCEVLSKFSGCPTVEHAIVAGLRRARGEAVAVVEPGDRYPVAQLMGFFRALARADFVCGRRRRHGLSKLQERLLRLPRWLLLGLDSRDPDCLVWAARREVFGEMPLLPRFVRHLPALVARQGFRVDSIYVEERSAPQTADRGVAMGAAGGPHVAPANLLAAWRECKKLQRAESTTNLLRAGQSQPAAAPAPTNAPDWIRSKSA
jgi:hypothetical protein